MFLTTVFTFLGFILGLWANAWVNDLTASFPSPPLLSKIQFIIHPVRAISQFVNPDINGAKKTIRNIFRAWENSDADFYRRQWSSDAVQESKGKISNLDEILHRFNEHNATYTVECTDLIIFTELRKTGPDEILAYVRYQQRLTRKNNLKPAVEQATDVYRLRRSDSKWFITHNYDHFINSAPTQIANLKS